MQNPSSHKSLTQMVEDHDLILMEAAIVERLRRSPTIDLHPTLVNAPLIYDSLGRDALSKIYHEI